MILRAKSWIYRLYPMLILALLPLAAALSNPVWWDQRGVTTPVATTNDYSAVNVGQAKNMAYQAYRELELRLPSGAGTNVTTLLDGFATNGNYNALNVGQLKYLAQPFWDRLIEYSYTNAYPWTTASNNYNAANLGQLKNVFSFDLRGRNYVGCGNDWSVLLAVDGSVWTWGGNSSGQLGTETNFAVFVPVQLTNLSNCVSVAAGGNHGIAIDTNGQVWGWGWNGSYTIAGHGASNQKRPPGMVASMTNMIQISAGDQFSIALRPNGTVWGWGYNFDGQLGTNFSSGGSGQVAGLSNISYFAAGGTYTVALRGDGTVWSLGAGGTGCLGYGSSIGTNFPVQAVGLSNVVSIAAGTAHTMALKKDGTVWAWGLNDYGQLGIGVTTNCYIPVCVTSITNVVSIGCGSRHSMAVKSDGTMWTWGRDGFGQLGNGSYVQTNYPAQITGITNVSFFTGKDHALATTSYRGVAIYWGWGTNAAGQIGNAIRYSATNLPVLVQTSFDTDEDGLPDFKEYLAGSNPLVQDSNGDGLWDGAAYNSGTSITNMDVDADNLLNEVELVQGTNPFTSDTDGDGYSDATDAYPNDPTRWSTHPTDTNDFTAPTITLRVPDYAN